MNYFEKRVGPDRYQIWIKRVKIWLALLFWLTALSPIIASYFTNLGRVPGGLDVIPVMAIIIAVTALLVNFLLKKPVYALTMLVVAGLIMLLKPIIRPNQNLWIMSLPGEPVKSEITSYSLTSETHLYFIIPGILLVITTLFVNGINREGKN